MPMLCGGIEAGGTKFVCAVGTGPDDIRAKTRIATTTPSESITQAIEFFLPWQDQLAAIGIASFGPVDLNPQSPMFGHITSTPKPGWANTDLVGIVRQSFDVPVAFDTDVNGAALGEYCWGAAESLDTFVYLTIGTGIGGGAMVKGALVHGLVHPEMGHIYLPPHPNDPSPNGFCPFHGNCLEGMANGPAMEKRWGQRAETLPVDHPAWDLEAHYLALGLASFTCTLSPQRIIMGGGVMNQARLFPLVRKKLQALLNGYIQSPVILDQIDTYIVPPRLGGEAGVLGAIALAQRALTRSG